MENKKDIKRAWFSVSATFNNTMVTVADADGNTLCWASAGSCGFHGTRKQTPYAATVTVGKAAKKARELGVSEVEVYIKGPGSGRDASLQAIRSSGLRMLLIADITPVPHNGPRPKKERRGK
ncbi:30S ribosomal protein S11 [Candidatus Shapirobacteria bacterium CG09_land_8_20_14_0_10_38_17]|uniref:Small ribosomal subunit protein uS11 n=1 Tax=Candidatus Shapirobacteria bacterium CG09_land_8_20_14_0_10_38_17 TaxID=1974884 RepID=A0A2H0WQV1_9BACT|nr:MAG: 30S ribosomal protein S11 [Candidatus Shapirobacteria bacterium CG09_land_8_20_14_0_10_38_17]